MKNTADLADSLNRKTNDELRNYVIELIHGNHDNDDEQLIDALVLYEGAPGLLRRLYQKLTQPHRETIAIAFWERLQTLSDKFAAKDTRLDQVTVAILKLADPFLLHSSIAADVTMHLETLASQLWKNRAPLASIAETHLAVLNMGGNFDRRYWGALSASYGEDLNGIVLTGLSNIDIDSAFEWLNSTPPSLRLSELVMAHLPDLYRRAPEKVERHLGRLVSAEGNWTKSAKDKIATYAGLRGIKITAADNVENPGQIALQRRIANAVCRTNDPLPTNDASRQRGSTNSRRKAKELMAELHDEMQLV